LFNGGKDMKPRLTYANVAATLALILAMSGTAIAAKHYIITSTRQIKPSVLRKLRGKAGPAGRQGPAGPAGPQGPQGPGGPAGPSNLSGIQVEEGPTVHVQPKEVRGALAFCPRGMAAVSGGGYGSLSGILASETSAEGRVGWFIVTDNTTLEEEKIHAQVLCAGKGQAVAADARPAGYSRARVRMEEHVAALVAKLRAEKAG
jgi:hypothetical protein